MASFMKRSKQRKKPSPSSSSRNQGPRQDRSDSRRKRGHRHLNETINLAASQPDYPSPTRVTNSAELYLRPSLTSTSPDASPVRNTDTSVSSATSSGVDYSSSDYSERLIAALCWNKDDFKVYHYEDNDSDFEEDWLLNAMDLPDEDLHSERALAAGVPPSGVYPEGVDPRVVPEDGADEDDDASSVSEDEFFVGRPAPERLFYGNVGNNGNPMQHRIRQQGLQSKRGIADKPAPALPFYLRPSLVRKKSTALSYDTVGFLKAREMGYNVLNRLTSVDVLGRFDAILKNDLLKERLLVLDPKIDKIFSSEWINDNLVVFGTKCNKIIVYDIRTGHSSYIPTLDRPTTLPPLSDTPYANRLTRMSISFNRGRIRPTTIVPWNGPYNEVALMYAPTKLPKKHARGGIYAARSNRAGDLLVTGGHYATDVAVYQLPDFTPVSLGVGAHRDIIFDIAWVSDRVFVSASRDRTLAIWKVPEKDVNRLEYKNSPSNTLAMDVTDYCSKVSPQESHEDVAHGVGDVLPASTSYGYPARRALRVRQCYCGDKVRALSYNGNHSEVAALTTNNYLHVFETTGLKQKYSRRIPMTVENVCLTVNEDQDLYAVGCKSFISILDGRTITPTDVCIAPIPEIGLRSLSFRGNIVTIGTGYGRVLFYDVRNRQFLSSEAYPRHPAASISSYGFPKTATRENTPDLPVSSVTNNRQNQPMPTGPSVDVNLEKITNHRIDRNRGIGLDLDHFNYNMPAIYTTCYDPSGTRLLTAGGPLHVGYCGAYAAIWQ